MYLVLTGNEYGVDILNNTDLKFIKKLEDAEVRFDEYLEEYSCAALLKIHHDRLEVVKQESNF